VEWSRLAQSRHSDCRNEFPLSGVKRTSHDFVAMSAYDPKRRFTVTIKIIVPRVTPCPTEAH
jgi:hypothetical protein